MIITKLCFGKCAVLVRHFDARVRKHVLWYSPCIEKCMIPHAFFVDYGNVSNIRRHLGFPWGFKYVIARAFMAKILQNYGYWDLRVDVHVLG